MGIGLILGPLLEMYLTRALRIAGGNVTVLFSCPLGNVLWLLVLLSLVLPYGREYRQKRRAQLPAAASGG